LALVVVGLGRAAPPARAADFPYYFPVQLTAPSCVQIGSTLTVSATSVDKSFQHNPTPGAGSGLTTGWDDEVQIIVNNVVLATAPLTYVIAPGLEFGIWNLLPTNVTVPAGVAGYQDVKVLHRRFVLTGNPKLGIPYRLSVADTAWGAAGQYMQNTCNPTTSVKPVCVSPAGGRLTISGQANRYSLNIVLDDAVTVASGVPADPSGNFSTAIPIPAVTPGVHRLDVGAGPPGDFSAYGAPVNFVVPCSAPPPPPPTTTTSTLPPPPPSTTTTATTAPLGPAVLAIAPPAADAGTMTVGQPSAPVVVTITNTGQSPTALVPAATLGGANPGDAAITADGCANLAIGPGMSCSVSVIVAPTDSGPRSMTLTYASTDTAVAPVTTTITATGAFGASIRVDPTVVPTHSSVTVTGKGFPPGIAVQLGWQGLGGTVSVTTDATGSFVVALLVPVHFGGGPLVVKVADQLPRFTGPTASVLVQPSTARPAGPSTARRPFWRG